jgi:transcriptional regulator with XRE-family HTH domain
MARSMIGTSTVVKRGQSSKTVALAGTGLLTYKKAMPKGRGTIDVERRDRIVNWVRYEMDRRQIDSIRETARRLGISHTYLARLLLGEQTPGLELVIRMHDVWRIDATVLLDEDPPKVK